MIGLPDELLSGSIARPRVAILGCGNVGAEVARQLRLRDDVTIASVLVRRPERERPVPRDLLTASFAQVLNSKPDVMIELLGGVEPARSHITAALRRGISVVTANKSVIARHGQSLHALAEPHGAQLRYEASVGAGAPVLAAIEQLRGDRITAIRGVVNGTCNFILERIEKTRCTLEEALAEAQRLGFAEPDPSADVSGRDSAEKLCVLAQVARWGWIAPEAVRVQGIESITTEDARFARQRDCVIRLVAEARHENDALSLRVGPTFVPRNHALATPTGCENAFEIEAENAGTIRLQGLGAGAKPTASAVISDLLGVAGQRDVSFRSSAAASDGRFEPPRRYYIRTIHSAGAQNPDELRRALNRRGIEADSVELHVNRTTVETLPSNFDAVADLVHSWEDGQESPVLVAPFVD